MASPQEPRRLPTMKRRVFKSGLFDVENPWARSADSAEDEEDDEEVEWELPLPDHALKKGPGGPPPSAGSSAAYWGFP